MGSFCKKKFFAGRHPLPVAAEGLADRWQSGLQERAIGELPSIPGVAPWRKLPAAASTQKSAVALRFLVLADAHTCGFPGGSGVKQQNYSEYSEYSESAESAESTESTESTALQHLPPCLGSDRHSCLSPGSDGTTAALRAVGVNHVLHPTVFAGIIDGFRFPVPGPVGPVSSKPHLIARVR